MAMKRLLYSIILVTTVLVCSCNNDEDLLTKQKDNIVKYLTSSRRMVAEEEVGSTIAENPPFYTAFGQSTYRHITNYYEADRNDWSEITPNSSIDIRFNAYIFSGSEPSNRDVYWSNIQETINALESANNHTYDKLEWSAAPLTLNLGRGEILEGLETALIGCRDQDSVQIYMTSKMAYGKQYIGSVPKNSSVAWYIKILNVNK